MDIANNEEDLVRSDDSITVGQGGTIDFSLILVPAGNDQIGFTALDYSGNFSEDYETVTVQ